MTISISIKRKHDKPHVEVPFSVHRVMEDQWRPFAAEHGLRMITHFGYLNIKRLSDAEQLLSDLRRAHSLILEQKALFLRQREYMLARSALAIPALEEAIGHWDEVEEIVV